MRDGNSLNWIGAATGITVGRKRYICVSGSGQSWLIVSWPPPTRLVSAAQSVGDSGAEDRAECCEKTLGLVMANMTSL